jgi:CRP-like cAMP-binding protein
VPSPICKALAATRDIEHTLTEDIFKIDGQVNSNKIELVENLFMQLSGMKGPDFALSIPYWKERSYKKHEIFNDYKSICLYLGFVLEGAFRTYYTDVNSGEEKNILLFSKHQMVVSYKSFVTQKPCDYYTECVSSADILYIHYDQLHTLYKQSHEWEHLGRMMAELAFTGAVCRAESFILQTPEQRYLSFIQENPEAFKSIPLYHISSYLGIAGPSLSRIRKRMSVR